MPDTPAPSFRCRAGEPRCDYRGTVDELAAHADEAGHRRCIVCSVALADVERQTCTRCVSTVRDDLAALVHASAHLGRALQQAAYRSIAWNVLALAADGSLESPQTPNQYTEPRQIAATVHVEHAEIPGKHLTHLAYVEERIPSNGREHVRDHWASDPLSVLAFLEKAEREWRLEFGHGPATGIATVRNCLDYLREHHTLAARTHPGFDDYATDVRELRSVVEHAVGFADVPVKAPASCFDCGGALVRLYTDRGLTDDWTCRLCRGVYDQASYFLALRARRDECEGWVPVRVAASVLRIPTSTLFRWAADGQVAVRVEAGRSLVEWSEVSRLREARAS